MASVTEIIARARVIATQMGGDANMSPVIDNKAGVYALLRNAMRAVYRKYANNQKFINDINVRHDVTITSGAGTLPDTVIREFLHQAQFQDSNGSLVTYFPYAIDANSGQNFIQLGYVAMNGEDITYTAPNGASYSGSLFITAPSVPEIPDDQSENVNLVEETLEDVIYMLAMAIRGEAI